MSQLDPTFHSAPSVPDSTSRERYLARGVEIVDVALLGLPAVNDPVIGENHSPRPVRHSQLTDDESSAQENQERLQLGNDQQTVDPTSLKLGSLVSNLELLTCVGKILYASAQSGHMSIAVAVMSVVDDVEMSEFDVAKMIECCQTNLRDTDVIAQSSDNEFIVIVTNVGKHNIAGIFERLSDNVSTDLSIDRVDDLLEFGTTADLGITFESMIHKARAELQKSKI